MTKENLEFYERRAREEAEAAKAATSREAASAHRFLALEYEARAKDLRSKIERNATADKDAQRASPSESSKASPRRKLSIR